jgi:endonuclease/exonuclease/phosphatase family metal-dependent hydrolase
MQESRQYLLTCAVVTLSLTASAAYAQPQAPDREVRVMSYNIKHGQTNADCTPVPAAPGQPPNPDCNLDIQASIDVIRAYGADIVAVQEVDRFWARSAYLDEPEVLAAGTGLTHTCYGANLDHAPDSHSPVPHQYGTVILSRFPILSCSNTLLRRVGTTEQRGLTLALVNVRGVPVQVYNTHLHTRVADRLLQTQDIAAVLDSAPVGPRVLMGDFNARSTFTTTVAEMEPIYARLVDTWREAPVVDPANPEGFTSPADLDRDPTSRIDYVFASERVTAAGTFVPVNAQTRLAADHYPVVADLLVPGESVGIGRSQAPGQTSR